MADKKGVTWQGRKTMQALGAALADSNELLQAVSVVDKNSDFCHFSRPSGIYLYIILICILLQAVLVE